MMKDIQNKYRQLQFELSYFNQEESPCNGVENINIIVHKKKVKNRKKYDILKYGQQTALAIRLSRSGTKKTRKLVTKRSSIPEVNKRTKLVTRSSDAISKKKKIYFNSKYTVNRVSEYHFNQYLNPTQKKWKVYRCQLNATEDSCCCSCNSDAMFEVMKSLYDCYKKKNCDNCNCILCGHFPREERRIGEVKKSLASVGLTYTKEKKAKVKKAEKAIKGKSKEEKEKILKELAKSGEPLPEGKTVSEKELIKKIRTEVGLPPEPKTAAEKAVMRRAEAAGVITPLEGKTTAQKEKILKAQAQLGVPLPEGRTASEKTIIRKIKTAAGIPEGISPEKMQRAKAAGLITPLAGKTPEQREKILRGLAMEGLPLPEGKTSSEEKLIEKVRTDLGLPPEPKTLSMREKYANAANIGLMQPLEGKSRKEKEKILQGLADMGIPLPNGRTASEKSLVAKVMAGRRAPSVLAPSEKLRKAKEEGLLTPLEGKTPEQKERILRGFAMNGIVLPEGKTASEKKLIGKVRADLGLPPEPKNQAMRDKHIKAADAGLLQPLEGKSPKEKEKILQGLADMGIPLPEGRTASEKALVAKVMGGRRPPSVLAPSEKLRKAKEEGLLTPLEGKTPEQKEKVLRGLAMKGIPLPEGKTASDRKMIEKVRTDLGLPPEPQTKSMRDRYARAADVGLLQPLEGKSAGEKEKILQGLHDMGVPLPKGRTASEKALIAKVKKGPRLPPPPTPSEKLRKVKEEGLLTPIEGKTPEQQEKILRGLAMNGIVLPEGKTASEKKLIAKVRADLGLPPEPKNQAMRDKHIKAAEAGLLQPLEGKSPKEKEKILQGLADMEIPLPEGRTASEKALVAKVIAGRRAPSVLAPSEKLRKAKVAGLLTPLADKSPAQREKILRGLAMQGVPLPEAKTASEKMLFDKVRVDLGLPPEPKTQSMRDRHNRAADAGILQPLEGKSPKEKENILQGLHDMGIPLPEGRTASEKSVIAKIKTKPRTPKVVIPSEKLRKAKAAGLLTPLEGKSKEQKEKILRGLAMQGIPLPEAKTASDKQLVDKITADLGLPPAPKTAEEREKYNKAVAMELITPLEGKTQAEKERLLRGQHDLGLQLPEGRTKSEKALIHKIKKTRAVGVGPAALPPQQRQKLDEKTAKVVKEGKGPVDECICGLLTPESEREPTRAPPRRPSEKLQAAKAAGLLTPLEGKTSEQKEKILRGLVKEGLPLPEGKTASERKIIDKIRTDVGLPPEPKTPSMKAKYDRAYANGMITPLEGKTASQKEKILRDQAKMGIPLPEGRTSSEKKLIAKIKASRKPSITTEKLRIAKAAGLLTPLEGKTPEQKEKILKGLAKSGLPLPEGRTASEKVMIKKIKTELGIPEITPSEKVRKAKTAGLLTPLEGKTKSQKERILRGRAAAGLPLPIGKTPSETALVKKIKEETGYVTPSPSERLKRAKAAGLLTPLEGKSPSIKEKILRERLAAGVPIFEGKTPSEREIIQQITAGEPPAVRGRSEKIRQAKVAGALTPITGKSPEQKEKILRGLVKAGLPMPEPKTASEKNLMDRIRQDVGLPPEPKTTSMKEKYKKAQAAGIITPLEGKTPAEKEKVLRKVHEAGITLPEGRTPSEKTMIKRIKAGLPERKTPSEKIRAAKAAGILTPLEGKTKSQKEKIVKGLAEKGLPMPEAKTASEKELVKEVRTKLGLPPEPETRSQKERMERAQAAGIITPLEGKTSAQKEKIIKSMAQAGIRLPEGRTASEKALIAKVKAESRPTKITSEKLRKAKEAGLLTPFAGKSAKEKEKIMKGLIKQGLPLPEPHTASERKIAEKVRKEVGLPPEPKTSSERLKMRKAEAAGIITPLEGKTKAQKEQILRDLAKDGIPLPEGRTASEKAMIKKIKAETGKPSLTPPALPPKERIKLDQRTAKVMKEGKGPSDECICSLLTPESEREEKKGPVKIPSEKLKKAKAAGLLTPLEGKSAAQKEKILRGLAKQGLPLPEAKTSSERKLTDKIRKEIGLPPEPKTASMREKHERAAAAGVLVPLEGLSPSEKERVLKKQADLGIALPEGRSTSEKALITKVKAEAKAIPSKVPSEKMRKAKAAGLLTPLEGKSTAQKEKILKGLAEQGLPLPEAKTSSEKKLSEKIRKELGLPPEPKTASMKEKHERAAAAGVLVPLKGLSPAETERILRRQADLGVELPEGRTPSEKALITKVKAESKAVPSKVPSEKMRRAKAAGLLTPLEGKTAAQKEKILRGLAEQGLPLPEAKTSSEKKLTDKIRKELSLPPEPKTASMKKKHERAAAAGVLVPLKGLSPAEKERVLRRQADLGIELPEGRTASEKALVAKVKAEATAVPSKIPSEKMRRAKAAGLLTPLEGKSTAQKEKILKGLAEQGLPLPEAKTSSERKLSEKIRKELGLPPEPKTASMKEKHERAAAAGVLVPLKGLSPAETERILRRQADLGVELPEGRTPSEKALITKVKAESKAVPSKVPSEKMRRAQAAGLLTPLEGKSATQKEKILRGLAEQGLPLPEAKTPSERKLTDTIRKELSLPPEPKTASMREKHERAAAAGVLVPLEGLSPAEKERVLRKQADLGIELPEGRTASEKALITKVKAESKAVPSKVPSAKMRRAKAAGLLTPMEGKSTIQKEKILKGLAEQGLPLPEAKTSSEKKLSEKIRKELGLPPEPKTASMKEKHEKAAAAGVLVPLKGLSPAETERILRRQAELGVELPEGRTPSEKALITKVKAESKAVPSKVPSEKMRRAKAAGLLTPLEGKTAAQKEKILRGLAEQGLPLPEAKTSSEKKLTDKIRKELSLPPEPKTASMKKKHERAAAAGVLVPLKGLSPAEKERVLRRQADLGVELPEGRTASEKALIAKVKAEAKAVPSKVPSEKMRRAKAAGLLTPLEGKTAAQKEKILRGLAEQGIPLPEAKTSSEKKLTDKIRKELSLPPEPKTASMREKHERAAAAGVLVPLKGLSPAEKERVLRKQADLGIELPEGKTASEKAIIKQIQTEAGKPRLGPPALPPKERSDLDKRTAKVMKEGKGPSDECICSLLTPESEREEKEVSPKIPLEKMKKAEAAGLLTPLEGKSAAQKEKILRGLAEQGLPLPEPKTSSEKKLTDKIRKEVGLPPEPKTASMRERHERAAATGVLVPLEGLSPAEKERVLRKQTDLGIVLPEGRSASERALITKVKAEAKAVPSKIPSEKMRRAKAAGLLTPLEGKSAAQKETILRGLAEQGLPLPEAKTSSERKLTDKIRKELGLPPEPKTASMRERHERAAAAGVLVPLEGLSPAEKERVLKKQADLGLALPEGRSASEKALITKVKAEAKAESLKVPSEKMRRAKAAGLLTPLDGKSAAQKEKILRGLAEHGLPLPEAKTSSERRITDKIRKEVGLPPEPKTVSMKEKHERATAAGVLVPLKGLSPTEKERVLRRQADLGMELPEGRTASEKALITKVKGKAEAVPSQVLSEKMRRAKAAGLLTPLEGKSAAQKEKILRGLAKRGLPLPEAKTSSERKLTDKIRKELGLPPEPKNASMRKKQEKAAAAGALVPLEGLSPAEKERVLRRQADLGIELPEGRTASEKALVAKVKAEAKAVPSKVPSEKMRRAKAAGLLTPLEGKTAAQKEKILRGLAEQGLPLPEGKTSSERKLTDKIRKEIGLPPEPKTASMREKHERAAAAGVLVPLEGLSPAEKERVLRKQADLGIALPEGRSASEKALITKVKKEAKAVPSKIPSEKMRRAKAAGLLTPLEGKTAAQKEKILRGLAEQGIPLPEPKTSSERKLTDKIRKEVGLPPEPKTTSMREKQEKAAAAGVLVPLEGLSPAEKERVLRRQADLGVELPEGRTASEKALIAKVKAEAKAIPSKVPSEKMRRAKAAGLLTPLEGKSAAQKEKILRGLAEQGIPLPEAKTSSEKKLTDKIRKELSLPPEPKTASMREKHERAAAAGVLVPLKGLSPAEKEKVLRKQADLGIELPEGKTASEKAMIKQIQTEAGKPKLGPPALPPKERSDLDKRTAKVMKEGKGPSDECICSLLTPDSEREEKKVPAKIPSEKMKKAKAAGLLTPLEGKSAAQKEKILKGLAEQGLPLPEAKTSSEKKLSEKIRKELGLPPEPKTASMKEKHEKAAAAGVLVPLEGLSPAEKEKVLRKQTDLGIVLPEGRSASERALITKVKTEAKAVPSKVPSEKMRRAKAAGLLTPLEGKSAAQKEKILRGLAEQGIPLPEAKTSSEKKLTDKIRKELSLPPEPKTASMREKHERAAAAGVLVPLKGLSPAEKERVLRKQADLGIELPEGRTASEKALVAKVKAETKAVPSKIPSEKMRRAKAAGLLTPLEGKSAAHKEKILRGLAEQGIPMPEAKTSSEMKLTDKIRKELSLPPEPKTASMKEKHERAAAAGVLIPLEGLSRAEKARVLRKQADLGIELPEGRTASEKSLISKVKTEAKAEAKGLPSKIPSEKIRKAKAAGLLTPLKGKSKVQKEKIMRELAELGLPLPEAKTSSERKLSDKIRKELGLPPEPKTESMREKHERAAAAGVLVPLEGLSPEEKKRVLRGQANLGLPLPEARTASEKALISKIKAEQEPSKMPSERKLQKAKAAGLLTPLEGKTHAKKEQIIRSLAEAGLPLPEGKTASEKSLIHKVRTELGIPPPAKTASEKAIVRKARAEGLLTPLAGKSAKEKERIIKGLVEAGIPLPEGKTASEKELIQKVRTISGLPPEPTPSEKRGEIKTRSKKVGVSPSKRITKGIGAVPGIREEFEDIIKTTTCDRGCGCDKKKIRFKHSYVKIRVTSPDISSLCPCPDECVPGVKAGAFIDNEGIKVTVGRVDGVTSFTSQFSKHILEPSKKIITLYDNTLTNSFSSNTSTSTIDAPVDNIVTNDLENTLQETCPSKRCPGNDNQLMNYDFSYTYTSGSNESHANLRTYQIESDKSYQSDSTSSNEYNTDESGRFIDSSRNLETARDIYVGPGSISCSSDDCHTKENSSRSSFDSILVIKSESSLSLYTNSTSSGSTDVISVISFSNSSQQSNSTHYLYCSARNENSSDSTVADSEYLSNGVDYNGSDYSGAETVESVNETQMWNRRHGLYNTNIIQNEYITHRLSQTRIGNGYDTNGIKMKTSNGETVIVINNLDSDHDITTMVDQLLSRNEFPNASSIFVVVPTSDDEGSTDSSDSFSSTICNPLYEHYSNWKRNQCEFEDPPVTKTRRNLRGLKISAKGKKYCMEELHSSYQNKETMYTRPKVSRPIPKMEKMNNKLCQIFTPNERLKSIARTISTDTTSDRPCCCAPQNCGEILNGSSNHRCVANVVSELITPLLVNQGLNCNEYWLPKINVNQQASFVSINQPPTSVTPCHIPPCTGHPGCHHSADMEPFPFGTPLPKPIPEHITRLRNSQPCQCSPGTIKETLDQAVRAGKTKNMRSTGCGTGYGGTTKSQIPISVVPKPLDKGGDCSACSKPKYKDEIKNQCICSSKKKHVKLQPLGSYEPVSKTFAGPKAGTRSLGCQCCLCDDSTILNSLPGMIGKDYARGMPNPMGQNVLSGPAGTCIQEGMRQAQNSASTETTPTNNCTCKGKRKRKKKNIICECPEPEPEPSAEELAYALDLYDSYEVVDEKQAMRMKSDMTQTQSGFKMNKKKRPPPEPELPELTMEDYVRYYASINPSLLADLVPPPQEYRERSEDCTCEVKKHKSKKVECICPYPPPSPEEPEGLEEPEEPAKEDEGPFRGFKLSMGGKGSGSKGLSGVCCFDMIQQTIKTKSRLYIN